MNKDIISKFLITNNKNQKRHPKVQKKIYIRRPHIKNFIKTDSPKVWILIQNTISKFSKTKN